MRGSPQPVEFDDQITDAAVRDQLLWRPSGESLQRRTEPMLLLGSDDIVVHAREQLAEIARLLVQLAGSPIEHGEQEYRRDIHAAPVGPKLLRQIIPVILEIECSYCECVENLRQTAKGSQWLREACYA